MFNGEGTSGGSRRNNICTHKKEPAFGNWVPPNTYMLLSRTAEKQTEGKRTFMSTDISMDQLHEQRFPATTELNKDRPDAK